MPDSKASNPDPERRINFGFSHFFASDSRSPKGQGSLLHRAQIPAQVQIHETASVPTLSSSPSKQRPKSQPRAEHPLISRKSISTPSTPSPHGNRSRLFNSENKIPVYSNDTEYNYTTNSNPAERLLDLEGDEEIKKNRRARTFCWYYLQSDLTDCPRSNGTKKGLSSCTTQSGCPYKHVDKTSLEDLKYVQKQLQKLEKYLRYAAHCNVTYMSSYLEFITKYGKCLSEIESMLDMK